MAAAGAVFEFRPGPDGFDVVAGSLPVGSVTAEPRRTPPVDCFDAHGRRLAPILDWVLTVDPGLVGEAAWAGALIVLDDLRPTVTLGA